MGRIQMRKFALFIWLITLTVPAVAEYGDLSPCLRYDRPYHCGGGCCAENRSMCFTRCPNISVLSCEGTECAGYTSWVVIPNSGSDARQFRCNTSTKKCEYRCNPSGSNTYYATNDTDSSSLNCRVCPDNCNCDGTYTVTGKKGYYPERYPKQMQGIGTLYIAACTRCPEYKYLQQQMNGNWLIFPGHGTTDSNAVKKVTECYIPAGKFLSDDTGKYQVTSDCYYKTTSTVIPIYPAN